MSSWSMDDGSDLSGTYTFTNGSAIVQGNSSADTTEIKVGDIVIDDNGDKVRVADIQPKRTVATSAVNASNEQITITNHGFVANQEVFYEANGGTGSRKRRKGRISKKSSFKRNLKQKGGSPEDVVLLILKIYLGFIFCPSLTIVFLFSCGPMICLHLLASF